uniref:Uncharacterized protein n=1 Tax=Ananas comosus var. bracteatus TaxID=296719 RepID=A0A6V7Q3W2_ANACO|nr:unnamed protein product [Ananas comosus var. bracteatus]
MLHLVWFQAGVLGEWWTPSSEQSKGSVVVGFDHACLPFVLIRTCLYGSLPTSRHSGVSLRDLCSLVRYRVAYGAWRVRLIPRVGMLELPLALRRHKPDYTFKFYNFICSLLGLVVQLVQVSNCPLGTINYSSHAPCFMFSFRAFHFGRARDRGKGFASS